MKLLVERDDVEADSKGVFGRTPSSYAAEGGHEAVVEAVGGAGRAGRMHGLSW